MLEANTNTWEPMPVPHFGFLDLWVQQSLWPQKLGLLPQARLQVEQLLEYFVQVWQAEVQVRPVGCWHGCLLASDKL